MANCLLTAFLCLTGVSFALATESSNSSSPWSYFLNDADGPDHWGGLCNGTKQSPININTSATEYSENLGDFNLVGYNQRTAGVNFTATNNGHTIKVTLPSGVYTVSGGGLIGTYNTAQFHLHWGETNAQGSEHALDGKHYSAELHFVSYNKKYANISEAKLHPDGLAVLGVLIQIVASANVEIISANSASSLVEVGNYTSIAPFELQRLLPDDKTKYYRYSGSLTTPTCNEAVAWTIFKDPVTISEAQVNALRSLEMNSTNHIVDNFRPLQKLGSRTVQRSYKEKWQMANAPVPTEESEGIALKISNIALLLMLFVALFLR